MRPVIIVDLDHVVYDWIQAMAFWLFDNDVIRNPLVAAYQYENWEVWEDWNIPEGEFMRWWRLGIEDGAIYGEGLVIPGARSALWKLSDADWDIHIATNRLNKFGLHDQTVMSTGSWLRDNNIPYRQLSFVSNKREIRADAIVDDVMANMDPKAHELPFLFPANHNLDYAGGVSASEQRKAWNEIVEALIGE